MVPVHKLWPSYNEPHIAEHLCQVTLNSPDEYRIMASGQAFSDDILVWR
jgi:hypothetical protein